MSDKDEIIAHQKAIIDSCRCKSMDQNEDLNDANKLIKARGVRIYELENLISKQNKEHSCHIENLQKELADTAKFNEQLEPTHILYDELKESYSLKTAEITSSCDAKLLQMEEDFVAISAVLERNVVELSDLNVKNAVLHEQANSVSLALEEKDDMIRDWEASTVRRYARHHQQFEDCNF